MNQLQIRFWYSREQASQGLFNFRDSIFTDLSRACSSERDHAECDSSCRACRFILFEMDLANFASESNVFFLNLFHCAFRASDRVPFAQTRHGVCMHDSSAQLHSQLHGQLMWVALPAARPAARTAASVSGSLRTSGEFDSLINRPIRWGTITALPHVRSQPIDDSWGTARGVSA